MDDHLTHFERGVLAELFRVSVALDQANARIAELEAAQPEAAPPPVLAERAPKEGWDGAAARVHLTG